MKYNNELLNQLSATVTMLRVLSKRQSELFEHIESSGSLDDLQAAIEIASEETVNVVR